MINIRSCTKENSKILTIVDKTGPNLLTIDVLESFHNAIDEFKEQPFSTLIIRGEGERYFSAGADLKELARLDGDSALYLARLGQSLFEKLIRLDKIVIAAIDGFCMGGGLDLLLACDLRYATPRSTFAHPGARMGIITGFGGTVRLPAEVGKSRAREIFFLAREISAEEACRIGLINGLVNPESLMERCLEAARKIAGLPRVILSAWKAGAQLSNSTY